MRQARFTTGVWHPLPDGIYAESGRQICSLPENEVDALIIMEAPRMVGMLHALNRFNPVFRAKILSAKTPAGVRQQRAIEAEDASRFLVRKILNF